MTDTPPRSDGEARQASPKPVPEQRAEAVRQYLLANSSLDPSSVEAMGYGETRPVASNEAVEGRERNRRIEIVIHPQLSAGR